MSEARMSRRMFLRGPARASERVVFEVRQERCLGSAMQVCTVCIEHCPEPGAIQLQGLLARIDAERCTGCGACFDACPAPQNALKSRAAS